MDLTRRGLLLSLPAAMLRAEGQTPVLVELFTSEGCSSCPPADRLLLRLLTDRAIEGVEVIALGQHVDYWDRLGWRDPFSSPRSSERQLWYSQLLRGSGPYTPQLVIDGTRDVVGSDASGVVGAITGASGRPKDAVELSWRDQLSVRIQRSSSDAEITVAIIEDNLSTNVKNGENTGRVLQHAAVVRSWKSIGRVKRDASFERRERVEIDKAWKPRDLAAIAFAQDPRTGRITAAARVSQNSSE